MICHNKEIIFFIKSKVIYKVCNIIYKNIIEKLKK